MREKVIFVKFRTDFVTNSSASSFAIVLTVETVSGDFCMNCDTDEQEGINVCFVGSPKQMANADSIEDLIDMIKSSFEPMYGGTADDDFDNPTAIEVMQLRDDSCYADLRELSSMDDVLSVAVRGDEGGWINVDYWCEYKYDKETGKYIYTYHGDENGNGCSGSIDVPDFDEIDEEIESNEPSYNDLFGF